jgi:hypothetical protein
LVEKMDMKRLKQALVAEFGVFALTDRRCRKVDLLDTFNVDGRSETDLASDRKPYGWVCLMTLRIILPTQVELVLTGNVPANDAINTWVARNGFDRGDQFGRRVVLTIGPSDIHLIDTLASMIANITRTGAPRYSEANYKHACPKASDALRRVAKVLREEWYPQQPPA